MKIKPKKKVFTHFRNVLTLLCGALVALAGVAVYASGSTVLCSGNSYTTCVAAGYTDYGYGANNSTSYWKSFPGHNCTNYVGYRLTKNGDAGHGIAMGSAKDWDDTIADHLSWGYDVNGTPAVGSIAQWEANVGPASGSGHMAYVESVVQTGTTTKITISEDNWSAGPFRWKTITSNSADWPTRFLHIKDVVTAPAPPPPTMNIGSDTDKNGAADIVLTTVKANGDTAAYSLLSTWGSFTNAQEWLNAAGYGWAGMTPLSGDVNGDKYADYIFITKETNGIKAFVSLSTGSTFATPQLWWNGPEYDYDSTKVSLGDADKNGADDLVLTTRDSVDGSASAFVLLSTWGSFVGPWEWWNGTGYGWGGVTPFVEDVNGDKYADYVFVTKEADGMKVFAALSNGTGFWPPQLWWDGPGWSYDFSKIAMGDVDGNGASDLVITTTDNGNTAAFVSLSTWGHFLNPVKWWDGTGYGWAGVTPFVGNVNGNVDGVVKEDFVFMTEELDGHPKLFSGISSGSNFSPPQLWWDGVGWNHDLIKATMR